MLAVKTYYKENAKLLGRIWDEKAWRIAKFPKDTVSEEATDFVIYKLKNEETR